VKEIFNKVQENAGDCLANFRKAQESIANLQERSGKFPESSGKVRNAVQERSVKFQESFRKVH